MLEVDFVTVISCSAATVLPSALATVARMVVVPAATPVTRPLPSTVATDGSSEDQATVPLADEGEIAAFRLVVLNSSTVDAPEMETLAAGTGAVTSTVKVSV